MVIWSPYSILSTHPSQTLGKLRFLPPAGVTLMTLGAIVYVRSAWDFAFGSRSFAPRTVVATGVYRFVRHPMYFGLVLILLGESGLFGSWILLGYTAVIWVLRHLFVTIYEDPTLTKRLGEPYRTYCNLTPRWVPKIRSTKP